jgi:hypothetical protein
MAWVMTELEYTSRGADYTSLHHVHTSSAVHHDPLSNGTKTLFLETK